MPRFYYHESKLIGLMRIRYRLVEYSHITKKQAECQIPSLTCGELLDTISLLPPVEG
jgi:hypothetical protein